MVLVKDPGDGPKPILNYSFKVPADPLNVSMVKDLQMMAAKDGVSFSELVRAALAEYYERHRPGNPQLALQHWTLGSPLPRSSDPKKRLDQYGREWEKREDGAWYRILR